MRRDNFERTSNDADGSAGRRVERFKFEFDDAGLFGDKIDVKLKFGTRFQPFAESEDGAAFRLDVRVVGRERKFGRKVERDVEFVRLDREFFKVANDRSINERNADARFFGRLADGTVRTTFGDRKFLRKNARALLRQSRRRGGIVGRDRYRENVGR